MCFSLSPLAPSPVFPSPSDAAADLKMFPCCGAAFLPPSSVLPQRRSQAGVFTSRTFCNSISPLQVHRSEVHCPPSRRSIVALAAANASPKASPFGALLGICAAVAALPTLLVMLLVHPLVLLRDGTRRAIHAALARTWLRLAFSLAGVKVRVVGSEQLPARSVPALLVANCQSSLDLFAVAAVRRPSRFMVPAAALRAPVVGWVMGLARWIGVGGVDRRAQMNALKDATAALEDGAYLCMFPEGVPSQDGKIGKFSPAPFRAAKKAGVPVVPITINGTRGMFDSDGKGSIGVIPVRRPKGPIEITVHAPIAPDAGSDKDIAALACDAVKRGLPA